MAGCANSTEPVGDFMYRLEGRTLCGIPQLGLEMVGIKNILLEAASDENEDADALCLRGGSRRRHDYESYRVTELRPPMA